MFTLSFEHSIRNFEMRKDAFDRDPINRTGLGVRRHQIRRPVDDPNYVLGELDFNTLPEAEACRTALHELWRSRIAAPALAGTPQTRILETIEEQAYAS